jgi:tetratricopeptide (TPR) repeat protein
LRSAREAAGLTQRQLSFLGCTNAYISRVEAGMRVPSLQVIREFGRRLHVSSEYLATGVATEDAGEAPILQAELALRLGDTGEAARVFRAMAAEPGPYQAQAVAGLGQIAFRAGRFRQAIRQLELAVELNERKLLRDPGAVESLARAHAAVGALESAIALLEEACEQARQAGAEIEVMRFAVLLANALIDSREFQRARNLLVESIRMAGATRDPLAHARVYWTQSRFHILNGEPLLAARYARRALDIFERTESDNFAAMAYHLLASAELETGDAAEALDHLRRGRELFADSLTDVDDAKFAIEEARALLGMGRLKGAAKAASRALELIGSLDPQDRGRSYVVLAGIFRANHDGERARELYELALELLEEHGLPYVLDAATGLSQLLEELGREAEALQILKRGVRIQHKLDLVTGAPTADSARNTRARSVAGR